MKVIHIFIASSIDEFKIERIYIGNYICRYNSDLAKLGYHLRLFLCEDESTNMQKVYDDEIEKSDIFLALIGNHIGEGTRHEIENIAAHSSFIKRRIIISKGDIPIPQEWKDAFCIYIIRTDFLKGIIDCLNGVVEEVKQSVPEKWVAPLNYSFIINITKTRTGINNAIIGNLIRVSNEQRGNICGILIEDDFRNLFCDAYVTIVSKDEYTITEKQRLSLLLEKNVPIEHLWIYANNNCQDSEIIRELQSKHDKYVVWFNDIDQFAIIFNNKLKDTILDKIQSDTKLREQFYYGYSYVVEDHLLKRVSLTDPENKVIIKNLYFLDSDLENQQRKERIIVNCMNIYHSTPGQYERYKKALFALDNNSYDFFLSDLHKMTEVISNDYDMFVSYIMECILMIQRQSTIRSKEEMVMDINKIRESIDKSKYKFDIKDEVNIDILLADILKNQSIFADEVDSYYNKAIKCFLSQPDYSDLVLVNNVLNAIISECEINYTNNEDKRLLEWVDKGYGILRNSKLYTDNDITRSKFYLLIYAARACRNLVVSDIEQVMDNLLSDDGVTDFSSSFFYNEAEKSIINKYKEDNTGIDLYIRLFWEKVMNEIMSGKKYEDDENNQIKELKHLCEQYMSSRKEYPDEYKLTYYYITILDAVVNNNIGLIEKMLIQIDEEGLLNKTENAYLDILYVYSNMLKRNRRYSDSIVVLTYLIDMYRGKRDIAICLQNKAVSHMNLYNNENELKNAENSYIKSLSLFYELKEEAHVGNVNDGLSFCYILQKQFEKAKYYAEESIYNVLYVDSNKYANYLSSLMCLGNVCKAYLFFYFKIKDKKGVRDVLKVDWAPNSEMNCSNIDTKKFNKLFILYDLFHKS